MVNRETKTPGNPLVETALNAIADWVSKYRSAIGFNNEFGMCGPDEVMLVAKKIGATPSQLRELDSKEPGKAKLLKAMLTALRVDPKVLSPIWTH